VGCFRWCASWAECRSCRTQQTTTNRTQQTTGRRT